MQQEMEPILDQPVEELKEVVQASEEFILNIITSDGKHEKYAEIYFEHQECKNLILPQDNLQEVYERKLSAN